MSYDYNIGMRGGLVIEKDPNGIEQHAAGSKLDAGKTRLGLVLGGFSKALEEVGKVGTFGANKYTDNGWKSVPNGEARYTDALFRHLLKESTEGLYDSETELQHAAHAAWNALARLELQIERVNKEKTIGGNETNTVQLGRKTGC